MANTKIQTLEEFLQRSVGRGLGKLRGTNARNLWRCRTLPDDELKLVFSDEFQRLSQPEKIQRITEHCISNGRFLRC